jgi:DnaJ-class molecular chaperone
LVSSAVGNAFAVINDPAKRKKYDMFGPEEEQRSTRSQREYDYSHGFEGNLIFVKFHLL